MSDIRNIQHGKKRAVITGIGPVAPNGIGKENFWNAIKNGISGIKKITHFNPDKYPFKFAGEISDLDPKQYLEHKFIKRTDRATQLSAVATLLALKDSNLNISRPGTENVDLILGSALGGAEKYSANLLQFLATSKRRMSPFAAVNSFSDACSGQLATLLNVKGCVITVNMACASGTQAIVEAYRRVLLDGTKVVIAVGTDAPILEEVVFAFSTATALSQKGNRSPAPFDKNRDGILLGEGAGALIVEELEHALSRKAPIYGEIIGYGNTTDASSIALGDESGGGKVEAIRKALESAGIQPDQVDYINAHGPGTRKGDAIEAHAILDVFGNRARTLPVSSTKSMIGHTQGACGALETIASLLALKEGIIPPTINYETHDEECNINCVPNHAIEKEVHIALKQSFGFGGKNAVLVLKKFDSWNETAFQSKKDKL